MKELKKEIKEWIFENLLLLLFKFSETHKLIRFQRIPLGGKIDYELIIRTTQVEGKEELEKHISEYVKNVVSKNLDTKIVWPSPGSPFRN
jgi:hypothetical protein